MPELKHVDIYTDGACSGNPGAGGWAAILIYKGVEKQVSGYNKECGYTPCCRSRLLECWCLSSITTSSDRLITGGKYSCVTRGA